MILLMDIRKKIIIVENSINIISKFNSLAI